MNFDEMILDAVDAAIDDHITALHEQIARQKTRIAELEDEAKQWQESCGQNYVRAEQADDRVNWFEQENDTLRKRIAALEAELRDLTQRLHSTQGREGG